MELSQEPLTTQQTEDLLALHQILEQLTLIQQRLDHTLQISQHLLDLAHASARATDAAALTAIDLTERISRLEHTHHDRR